MSPEIAVEAAGRTRTRIKPKGTGSTGRNRDKRQKSSPGGNRGCFFDAGFCSYLPISSLMRKAICSFTAFTASMYMPAGAFLPDTDPP